ncbi:MAG: DUF1631 domain-containing protein [Pseudomonadota bacterium]
MAPKLEVVDTAGSQNSIYKSIRRFAQEGLSDLIRVMMENVDDALFELSDKVDNDRERNMYFEAMREIRLKRSGIQKNFDYEIQNNFDGFIKGRKTPDDIDDDDDELTLVELDDLEDNIAIENMISKARPHFEDDLFAVSERLKAVLKRKEIAQDDNPLDPKSICDSFHNASEILDTDIQVKLIFYKLFERYVVNNLGHFYRDLNQVFVQKGVLPSFKAEQERMKQTSRFMANRIKSNPPREARPAPGIVQPVAAQAPASGSNLPSNDGNLFNTLQQALNPGAAQAPAMEQEAFEPVGGVVAEGLSLEATPVGFVSALTQLQGTNLIQQPVTTIDPQNFKTVAQQQLIDFKQQNSVNPAQGQTIDVISMLFDFFFDDAALPAPIKVLIGRLQIPMLKVAIMDPEFFNQKKHPARKLLDSISRASLGWGDNHDDHQPLIDKTESIVNFLIEDFDQDISVFEKALDDFESFLQQEDESIEAANEELRQQEQEKDDQIQIAQQAAADLIAKLTHNQDLSFEVIDFLETTWSSVLFNAYFSLGEDSNHWKNLKRISTTFVWSLIPKFSKEDRIKIIKTIPALLRSMSKGMDLIKINREVQNRIFRLLAKEHAKIVKQTSKNIVTRIDDETIWPEDKPEDAFAKSQDIDFSEKSEFEFSADNTGQIEVEFTEAGEDSITVIEATPMDEVIQDLNHFSSEVKAGKIKVDEEIVLDSLDPDEFDLAHQEDDFLEQAQTLEIGDWVEFDDSESELLVARLSWKSNVTEKLVFVNRQGHKVKNLSINDLAKSFRIGSAKRIESSSVFDRAIFNIMSKMKH